MGSLSSFSQSPKAENCKPIQTGYFYALVGKDTCYIQRTEDRQIEHYSNVDKDHEYIVIWLNDCKYILRDPLFNPTTKPYEMRKDVVMTIQEITPNYYLVKAKQKGKPKQFFKIYFDKRFE